MRQNDGTAKGQLSMGAFLIKAVLTIKSFFSSQLTQASVASITSITEAHVEQIHINNHHGPDHKKAPRGWGTDKTQKPVQPTLQSSKKGILASELPNQDTRRMQRKIL